MKKRVNYIKVKPKFEEISNVNFGMFQGESLNISDLNRPNDETRQRLKECFVKISYPYTEKLCSLESYTKNVDKYELIIYNSTKFTNNTYYYNMMITPLFFLSSNTSVYEYAINFKENFNRGKYELLNLPYIKIEDYFPELFMNTNNDKNILSSLRNTLISDLNEYINYISLTSYPKPKKSFNWGEYVLKDYELKEKNDTTVWIYDGNFRKKEFDDMINDIVEKRIKNKKFLQNVSQMFPHLLNEK